MNLKKDVIEKLSLKIDYDENIHFRLFLDEKIGNMLKRYCEMNCMKNRKWLFANKNGEKIVSSQSLDELRKRAKEKFHITEFSATAVGLTGVQKLLEKGMSIAEIKIITGFGIKKIYDVAEYSLKTQNIEKVINEKLIREPIEWC